MYCSADVKDLTYISWADLHGSTNLKISCIIGFPNNYSKSGTQYSLAIICYSDVVDLIYNWVTCITKYTLLIVHTHYGCYVVSLLWIIVEVHFGSHTHYIKEIIMAHWIAVCGINILSTDIIMAHWVVVMLLFLNAPPPRGGRSQIKYLLFFNI